MTSKSQQSIYWRCSTRSFRKVATGSSIQELAEHPRGPLPNLSVWELAGFPKSSLPDAGIQELAEHPYQLNSSESLSSGAYNDLRRLAAEMNRQQEQQEQGPTVRRSDLWSDFILFDRISNRKATFRCSFPWSTE